MATKELNFILKHSSVYGIGNIVAQAAGFLLLPFYTTYLTPKDYGIAALVETTVSIIGVLASMGIGYSIARFYSDKKEEAEKRLVVSTAYILILLLNIVFIPLCFKSSAYLSDVVFQTTEYGTFFFLSSCSVFVALNIDLGQAYFVQKARSVLFVTVSLANTLTLIAFNVYFIAFKKIGLLGIFYSSVISKLIFAILVSIPILLHIKLRFSLKIAISMIKFSVPLAASTVFRVLSQQSDKYFINYFFSPVEAGIYAVAGKFASSVHVLITTTFLRSYQAIRFEIYKEPDGNRTYGVIFEKYLFVIGSFALIISIYSKEIIDIMASDNYFSAAFYIPPLILSWILFGMKYHFENGILISMKSKYISYISALSTVANAILNYLLIPVIGIWGAVIASNISNLIIALFSYVISQKLYSVSIDWLRVIKFILILSVAYSFGLLASRYDIVISLLAKSVILITYFTCLFKFSFLSLRKPSLTSDCI